MVANCVILLPMDDSAVLVPPSVAIHLGVDFMPAIPPADEPVVLSHDDDDLMADC